MATDSKSFHLKRASLYQICINHFEKQTKPLRRQFVSDSKIEAISTLWNGGLNLEINP